jgi:hypothetical protein
MLVFKKSAMKNFFLLMTMILFVLSACTRAAPTIDFWNVKIVYQQNESGSVFSTLSFFVIANDPDGPEDLGELRLYNDTNDLMWLLTSKEWTLVEDRGKTWVGSKMFRMPEGESFPRGQYRAVISDKGGESSGKAFGFDAPRESVHKFPTFTITGESYTAVSTYPENYLMSYFEDGTFKSVTRLSEKQGFVSSLRLPTDVVFVALWGDDTVGASSALTNKINVRP